MKRCFQIHPDDNVAVLMDDVQQGDALMVVGMNQKISLRVNETIKNAQKVALDYLSPGTAVIKYGICIGHATQDVKAGDCIHLHNLSNDYDERSETLDLQSGLSTDMVYE